MSGSFLQDLDLVAANGEGEAPAWLLPLRLKARERFEVLGFPTTRDEDWKFTSVAPIAQGRFQRPNPGVADAPASSLVRALLLGAGEWCELVFVNGRFSPELSDLRSVPEGVTVSSLAQAVEQNPGLLQKHLGHSAEFENNAFTALNTAFLGDGAFVHVPAGTRVATPIHLLFLTHGSAGGVATHPRNLIVADTSAEVTVIESYAGTQGTVYFTNAVTEVVVGANSRVEHLKLQRESELAYHVGTLEARQQRDSRFRSFSFAIGGAIARTNIYSVMTGENSDCTMNGLYLLHGTQHIDHQTRIEHAFPNCTSREVYKGILDGSSHAVFNGKVYVRPEAQKTDGKQTNKNLLLSEGAKIDTKPQLEIFADDVKCTHGATVGRLDDLGLFYLESRGIPAPLARRMMTYGFAADVLGEVGQEPIRQRLEQLVFERLETPKL